MFKDVHGWWCRQDIALRNDSYNLIKLLNSLIVCLLLLISCKVFSEQVVNDSNFDKFIEETEGLKDNNPRQAFERINTQKQNIGIWSLENQLIYFKLLTEIHVEMSQYSKSIEVASSAINIAKQLSAPSIITAELLYSRGFAIESLGDYESAREDYRNGLQIAESLGDKKNSAMGLINLGALGYLNEKFDRSLILFNDALKIAQQLKDEELLGSINSELGILYSYINQEEKSLAYYQKSYEHYLKAGKSYYAYNTLMNIAANYSVDEKFEKAIPIYEEIIKHAEQVSNNDLLYYTYSGMAWAQVKQENTNPEAAHRYMLIANQYAEQIQQVDFPINHALTNGFLLFELERYQEALNYLIEAEALLVSYNKLEKKIVSTFSNANVLFLKSELHYKLENYESAFKAQEQLIEYVATLPERSNIESVEDVRIQYEAEQASIQQKILKQRQSVQSLLLSEAKDKEQNRQKFMLMLAFVSIVLGWVLLKTLQGQRKLLKITRTDALTGIGNRRWLMSKGKELLKFSKQSDGEFALLLIDVDDFKKVNDLYGHHIGDKVLKAVVNICEKPLRKNDKFARFGGEEFVVILPDTNAEQSCLIAEKLRSEVNEYNWSAIISENISISIGIANNVENFASFDDMLKQADKRLYRAKHLGKNRVCDDA